MRTAVLVPCYKRPEYTKLCLEYLEKAQEYKDTIFVVWNDDPEDSETSELIDNFNPQGAKVLRCKSHENKGLRNIIISFFFDPGLYCDYIAKIDNDCLVPKNWLNDLIHILETTDRDIISPNVFPSNAAFLYGKESYGSFRPSDYVGGLWCMKANLIKDIYFERFKPNGISGAFNIIKQIIAEKEAKCGWAHTVTVEDIGHWSGTHPMHIKTQEHEQYSAEVGRNVAWNA